MILTLSVSVQEELVRVAGFMHNKTTPLSCKVRAKHRRNVLLEQCEQETRKAESHKSFHRVLNAAQVKHGFVR